MGEPVQVGEVVNDLVEKLRSGQGGGADPKDQQKDGGQK